MTGRGDGAVIVVPDGPSSSGAVHHGRGSVMVDLLSDHPQWTIIVPWCRVERPCASPGCGVAPRYRGATVVLVVRADARHIALQHSNLLSTTSVQVGTLENLLQPQGQRAVDRDRCGPLGRRLHEAVLRA